VDIGELLLERQRSLFVGREKEFAMLEQALSDPDWQLLNIHGPGGIGKTTLLRLFAQTIDPARCFYFDGHSGFQTPDDFLTKMKAALRPTTLVVEGDGTDLLNEYAGTHQGIILLLDTFEQWGAIENWLRNDYFLKLNPLVKVIIAGRYALTDQWLRGNWNLLVQNIELQPLSFVEVQTYAKTRGIVKTSIVGSLLRFSRGLPLALSMACEIIVRKGNTGFLDQPQQTEMIGYLATELTKGLDDASFKQYLEAASVIWKFNQETLQTLLQMNVSTEQFRSFCKLPFVIRQENHWSLHDSVRQWIFSDFRSRLPQSFYHYRQRALTLLREREANHPDKKAEIAFEKLYLHEDDFIRSFCFQWDDSLALRECAEQDFEQVEQLYSKYLHTQSNYVPEDTHLEPLLHPLWHIDPRAFTGLWRGDQLVAFCSCIPLTEQTIPFFRDHPITAPATAQYDPNQEQCIICLAGLEPRLENEIGGSVARAMVKIVDRNAFIINLISMPNWIPYLPLLGFERTPWADSSTQKGVDYLGYQLDLRKERFSSKVDRMFPMADSVPAAVLLEDRPYATESTNKLPLEEAVVLVQRALKHFSRLPLHPEISSTLGALLTNDHPNREADAIAQQLQDEIHRVLHMFAHGDKEAQRFSQILHYAYIQKIGTHERVAEYLNIPNPSYYRYLRAAVRRLAYEITK
jgi:hypothetical protein